MKRIYTDSRGFKHKIKELHALHLQNAIQKLRRYRNPKMYEMLASLEKEQRRRNEQVQQINVDFNQLIKS